MNTNYLREFFVTARLKNFSKAAETLFISQSSLSKHISSLEKELGVTLFERNSRNVELSDIGVAILPYVSTILENEARISRLCEDKQRILQSRSARQILQVASVPVMAAYGITGLSMDFQKENPNIQVQLQEYEPEAIPSLLSSRQCELAFIRHTPSLQYRYETIPLQSEKILAILPESHPLAKEKSIQLSQLSKEQLIFLSLSSVLYGICMDLCISAGFLPNVVFTGHRPENMIDLVSRDMGIALLTESFFQYYAKEHTVGVEITPTATTRMVLARIKDQPLSWAAQLYWDHVEAQSKRLAV